MCSLDPLETLIALDVLVPSAHFRRFAGEYSAEKNTRAFTVNK